MTIVNLYEAKTDSFDKMLPKLMESIVAKGHKVNILCEGVVQMQELDKLLWSYAQLSFLPHATVDDEHLENQPIVLSYNYANYNGADILVLVDYDKLEKLNEYQKVLVIASNSAQEKQKLYDLKSTLQKGNFTINHYTQGDNGNWIINKND